MVVPHDWSLVERLRVFPRFLYQLLVAERWHFASGPEEGGGCVKSVLYRCVIGALSVLYLRRVHWTKSGLLYRRVLRRSGYTAAYVARTSDYTAAYIRTKSDVICALSRLLICTSVLYLRVHHQT